MLGATSIALSGLGHLTGGGHFDPVLIALLTAGAALASYGWLRRERGLLAVVGAVLAIQIVSHVVMSVGHAVMPSPAMVLTHLGSAVLLAVFLRTGEARIFAAARRRYLYFLVALRLAAAGRSAGPVPHRPAAPTVRELVSLWLPRAAGERGPPVSCCQH